MLTQILALMDEGNALSITELAQQLEISEDAVKAQMEYLERLGILCRVNIGGGCEACSSGCSGCGQHSNSCPVMWEKISL